MMIQTEYDNNAHELVITTPHGQIIVNECNLPHITRVTILQGQGGMLNVERTGKFESPMMVIMYGPCAIEEPPIDPEDTQWDLTAIQDGFEAEG